MAEAAVPVEEHLARVLGLVDPLPVRLTAIDSARGAVLVRNVVASEALPRFDHAAMDGYAVRAADVGAASADDPVSLPVVGSVAAGARWPHAHESGTALRIMTGAPVPAGADLVVPFEWTDRGDPVLVHRPAPVGRHIRRAGEDLAAGAVALPAGTVLGPQHLGLLAAVGTTEVPVRTRPRVAVVVTGDELLPPGARFGEGAPHSPDSNTTALAATASAAGASVVAFGPVPDEPGALLDRLLRATEVADVVVTTGGISAGDHDVVKAALRDQDGFWFGSVAIKPGRPQGCGVATRPGGRSVPVVCLPGTPVAAYLSFLLFVRPALDRLTGLPQRPRPRAPLAAPVPRSPDRTLLLPAAYDDRGRLRQLAGHVGHSQLVLARADAVLVVGPGPGAVPAGEEVELLPLHRDGS